jgi:uncharacterized protein (DUF1015 family)
VSERKCFLAFTRLAVIVEGIMATLKPFAALRPKPDLAAQICELPYDVMSSEEARQLAADNPLSFLHVSKPEIGLPAGTDLYAPEVYARGKDNFERLIRLGALRQDGQPSFYLYRQVMGRHSQTGLVAVADCDEYVRGIVKKHEFTRPDKESDRARHIETLNAQTGPVFLVHRARAEWQNWVAQRVELPPDLDFTACDGVRHTSWTIANPQEMAYIQGEFASIPSLYIADGHHRCAAAARVCQTRNGAGHSKFFLSVIFPHDQVQILPYNRVMRDLNDHSPERLLEKLGEVFVRTAPGTPSPARKHEVSLLLGDKWHTLQFRPRFTAAQEVADRLDATLLQNHVLAPIFGIDDPRTSKRVNFVGGIRGPAELERLIKTGGYACAFALHATSIEDLMSVADAGSIMPPKSTWFEPKLRDAVCCHLI